MSAMEVDDGLTKEQEAQIRRSILHGQDLYLASYGRKIPVHEASAAVKMGLKIQDEYAEVQRLQAAGGVQLTSAAPAQDEAKATDTTSKSVSKKRNKKRKRSDISGSDNGLENTKVVKPAAASQVTIQDADEEEQLGKIVENLPEAKTNRSSSGGSQRMDSKSLILHGSQNFAVVRNAAARGALIRAKQRRKYVQPKWHAPWKLMRVISGHVGWVRSIAVDPSNQWFATGSADRTIKIWDLASGTLKLSLTGHINSVLGLAISDRHPYMFSVGQDKLVRCWDMEQNKTIRSYHGHLSGVFTIDIHPTLDLICTGGRDASVRVWDIRTKAAVFVLSGHTHTTATVVCQATKPQILSGSMDRTVRLWDLAAGKSLATLTNHKKSIRSLVTHPKEYTFASGAADNIKIWKCPEGKFMRNHSGHNAIINTLAVNRDDVLVSGADNGSMQFWDWKSGYCFQKLQTVVQPGSLESESGIFEAKFDMTGSRLITAEADKTIKVWKEDPTATPETHPIDFRPEARPAKY